MSSSEAGGEARRAEPAEPARPVRREGLAAAVAAIDSELADANRARETALAACRQAIRAAGSSVRAVHRLDAGAAAARGDEAGGGLRGGPGGGGPHSGGGLPRVLPNDR